MGWGKAGVIYCMDSLLHASSAPLLSLHLRPNTHLLAFGSKETKPAPWVSGGLNWPQLFNIYLSVTQSSQRRPASS
jgi:hypothetical protein